MSNYAMSTYPQTAVVYEGIDPNDQFVVEGYLGQYHDLAGHLSLPVLALRELGTKAMAGSPEWSEQLKVLFEGIDYYKKELENEELARGYKLREIAPRIHNPFFKEPVVVAHARPSDRDIIVSQPAERRSKRLARETLEHWRGKISSGEETRVADISTLAVLIGLTPPRL